jgi:predicted metalloprotease with PDZ domain
MPPAAAPPQAPVDTLRYTFEYRPSDDGTPTLAVEVRFRADPSGRTRVVIPSAWAGETSLANQIGRIEAGPNVTTTPVHGDEETLISRPRAEIRLSYVLHQDWSGLLRYATFHRVVLDGSRVAFNQSNALIYPEHGPNADLILQVQWAGLPPDWRIVSSVGSKARFSGTVSWREFSSMFFAAGDFRLVALPSATGGMTIAAQGRWPFGDPAFARLVDALSRAETRFWERPAFPRTFVLLLPIDDAGTVAGTAFSAGLFAVSDSAADLKSLGRLLAHELFHLWNGQRMTAAAHEVQYKWFTEGFTDYYADRIFHGIGQYSDADYRDRVNAVLRRYYASPARNSTRDAVAKRYWSDDDVKQYPYAQGYALALYLQAKLPAWTASSYDLDSLMIRAYAAVAPLGLDISDRRLIDAVPAAGQAAFADALAEYIDRGTMVPADPGALGACSTVRTQAVYTFDLGFDADASRQNRVVTGVRPGGPAAAAGVTDGMRLVGWSWDGDPSTKAIVQVDDGRGLRQLTYFPHDNSVYLVPQYQPAPQGAGCSLMDR